MNLYKLIETEGMVEVASLGHYADWQWDDMKVWYHPVNDQWYWLREGGCSCNYWGDFAPYSLGALADGDRQAAMRSLKDFGASFDETEREVASVRDYKHEVTK